MTITTANYLDLWGFFTNELIGDVWLAYLILSVLILVITIKSDFDLWTTIAIWASFSLIFVGIAYNPLVAMIVVLLVGIPSYFIYSAFIKG